MPQDDINIFIAYSREDADLLSELKTHLVILERTQNVKVWYDGMIEGGADWQSEIKGALLGADIILLLISADFIASDYCYEHEMTQALELHDKGKVTAIPIILRECLWQRTPFAKLQALPRDGMPVSSANWDTPERPYVQIVEALEKKIDDIRHARQEGAAKEAAKQTRQENKRKFEEAVLAGDEAKDAEKWKLAKQHYELAKTYYGDDAKVDLSAIMEKINGCDRELEYSVNLNLAKTAFAAKDFKSVLLYGEKASGFKSTEEIKKLVASARLKVKPDKPPIFKNLLSNKKLIYGAGGILAALVLTFIGVNLAQSFSSGGSANLKFITDFKGLKHSTVLIGGTYWMTNNLNLETKDSWCYELNEKCDDDFGRFYTWDAAKMACPAPFRLPARDEWSVLKNQYKSEAEGFSDLMTKGKSGFDALLNGYGVLGGSSDQKGKTGHYWTSETDEKGNPYQFTFDYIDPKDPKIYEKPSFSQDMGYSCRCVLDEKSFRLIESEEFKKDHREFDDNLSVGNKLLEDKDYKGAKTAFLEAIAIADKYKQLNLNVSEARSSVEECDRIMAVSEHTSNDEQEKMSKYKDFMSKGNLYFAQKNYAKAIESYQAAENIFPDDKAAEEGIRKCRIEIAKGGPVIAKPGSFIHPKGFKMNTVIIGEQEWLASNLNISMVGKSFCYDLLESNCRTYGQLFKYGDAWKSCSSLGSGWKLPSTKDWAILADKYGNLKDDRGKAAVYEKLTKGESKMDLLLGGYRSEAGKYTGMQSGGYYWTTSPNGDKAFSFFLRNNKADLSGFSSKGSAYSCRCVRAAK